MTVIPGTVFDPDILLGPRFVPNLSWTPTLYARKDRLVCADCLFFCSFLEFKRLRTLAICQQPELRAKIENEIKSRADILRRQNGYETIVYYGYYRYSSLHSDLVKIDSISKVDFPETLIPLVKIFINKYRPFEVQMTCTEALRRMGEPLSVDRWV